MLDSPKLTSVLYCSLALLTSLLIPPQVAAPVVKPMPFEDEYITEIAAIDYPEERIEAYTDGGMVEYIRDKRAEPSPSPTYWPIEEVVTTSRYPIMDEDGIIEIIRQKKEAEHAVMFRPVKEYITTTRYPLLGSDGTFQVIRNKRAAQPGSTKFWPVREIITTTRRPFRKGVSPELQEPASRIWRSAAVCVGTIRHDCHVPGVRQVLRLRFPRPTQTCRLKAKGHSCGLRQMQSTKMYLKNNKC
ncbi:uncharacterized protein [Scyliorhinus torazame]|uniref:uncharacterized protein isoform X2 n=1 Tax=Scyliorhinus torazame TaxID=75743 RepID=UPI003B5BE1C3